MRNSDEFRLNGIGRLMWLVIFLPILYFEYKVWTGLLKLDDSHTVELLVIHVICALLGSLTYLLIREQEEMFRMLACSFICMLILPFFGPALLLIYELFQAQKPVIPFSEPESRLYAFTRKQTGHLEDILDVIDEFTPEELDLLSLQWTDIQPLLDVIHNGSLIEKCNALNSTIKEPTKESVELVRIALKDPSKEVRYYASTALTKIETEILDRLSQLQKDYEQNPGDDNLKYKLVDFYIQSCSLNIFSQVTAIHYLNSALELIVAEEDSPMILELKCRIYQRLKSWNSIYMLYRENNLTPSISPYICEALLNLFKLNELRDYIQNIDLSGLKERPRETLSYWRETSYAE